MIVMKFGGSSVKDANMFKQVASIVREKINKKPVVVLSATKGTTDQLLLCIEEALKGELKTYDAIVKNHAQIISDLQVDASLLKEELDELKEALHVVMKSKQKTKQITDYISFFGERMSIKIYAAYMTKTGTKAESHISGDIGLITDSNFGDATMLDSSYLKMRQIISKMTSLPVITGFGGKDEKGEYTTFQRGGSDYVASLIGAAIDAEAIEIWTDVNGIMTADPRVVKNVRSIPVISFDEASELAYFGAKVLHPKTILPAVEKSIPVLVLNTFEPKHPGTKIIREIKKEGLVTALTFKKGITIINAKSTRMLNAHGYLAKIFEVFSKYKKPVDMIATSEVAVSMSIDSAEKIDEIEKELKHIAEISIHKNKAMVNVVGENMPKTPGIASKILAIVGEHGINIDMISACFDGISLGMVVDETKAEDVMRILHQKLLE